MTRLADQKKRQYFGLFAVALAVIAFPLLVPNNYYRSVMLLAGIYAIYGIGWSLIVGRAGILNLAHQSFIGIGAYTSGILTIRGFNPWLAMILGVVVTCAIAAILSVVVLRLADFYLAIATIAFASIVVNVVAEWRSVTGGRVGLINIPPLSVFGYELNAGLRFYFLVWIVVVVFLAMSINLANSRVGRALSAAKSSEVAARTLGIAAARYKVGVFVLGSAMASVGGSLYAHYLTVLGPEAFAFHLLVLITVMVILGGMGSIWGAPLGAVVVVLLQQQVIPELTGTSAGQVNLVVFGALIILLMLFLPQGVVPAASKLLGRARRSRASGDASPPPDKPPSAQAQEPAGVGSGRSDHGGKR